jgi:hypothetical protein
LLLRNNLPQLTANSTSRTALLILVVDSAARMTASALRDWIYYDMEKSADAIKSLVNNYLARDYSNPIVESEIKGVRFDFLKCLDLYHSKELDAQAKRFVINANRTYRQDNPPSASKR